MAGPTVPPVYHRGRNPSNYAGNGRLVTAEAFSEAARYINMLAGRRLKVHLRRAGHSGDYAGGAGVAECCRGRFHTSPNVTALRARIVCQPVNSTSTTINPQLFWEITTSNNASAGTATHGTVYVGRRKTGTIVPDDHFVIEQVMTGFSANTTYNAVLWRNDFVRIISVVLYEFPLDTVDINDAIGALDYAANPSSYYAGAEIVDGDITDLHNASHKLWERQGMNDISWSRWIGTAISTTSATFTNVLDATTTAYSATTAGFPIWPYKRGTRSSNNIPVVLYAYGTGSTGEVRFTNSGGTIGTVTLAAAATWATTTGNLDASQASDKVDVMYRSTNGVSSVSLLAAGMYEYQT